MKFVFIRDSEGNVEGEEVKVSLDQKEIQVNLGLLDL